MTATLSEGHCARRFGFAFSLCSRGNVLSAPMAFLRFRTNDVLLGTSGVGCAYLWCLIPPVFYYFIYIYLFIFMPYRSSARPPLSSLDAISGWHPFPSGRSPVRNLLRLTLIYFFLTLSGLDFALGASSIRSSVLRQSPGACFVFVMGYPYYASLSGACTWEGYGPRITYPYYASSAESPPERIMDHALRIRTMYQAPKARRRELWTTHYVY